ncbi:MAG: glutamate--tRNA ligase [Gemmataceae bacterium]|nr:glutamate--tRNA ligase [Gemmataceae bacterium]MDW8263722.1 glutamate--tRNA ligase [Gemmataceae bacterium]
MAIRTRFAPSPTGYLHIGGVRTALFNWLLTRRLGGQFILRIDDTDAERNRPEALQPILDGFRWLGIDWDEGPEVGGPFGPYFQSQRNHLYVEAALRLLDQGHAYPCYRTKEELEAERRQAEQAKRPYVHRGEHRDTPPAENRRLYDARPTALRLKVPLGQTVVLNDLIRGRVEWQTDLLGDPVILRPDGRALYNFATVVDDVAMRITHVIRAAEHLSNTPIQMLTYQALGEPTPLFAHVPVVNEPKSKKKLSKRDMGKFVTPEVRAKLRAVGWTDAQIDSRDDLNPATVAFYRELGYLPAALVNYLGRLGWSLDDKSEMIPLEQMIAHFSLERVNDAPASFDPDKLYWLAGEYMRLLPVEERVAGVIPFLQRAGLIGPTVDAGVRDRVRRVVEAMGDRLKLFSDILLYAAPLFRPEPVYEPAAVQKRLKKPGVPELLWAFRERLAAVPSFEAPALEELLRRFCEERGIAAGLLIHALRVSTTGTEVGPGVFDCLAILGREEVLRRIALGLRQAAAG